MFSKGNAMISGVGGGGEGLSPLNRPYTIYLTSRRFRIFCSSGLQILDIELLSNR